MIIFVSGLIGAGKSTLARGLAETIDCPYFDIDEIKKAVFREDPDYEHNMQEGIPFSSHTRALVYERVIKDLRQLRMQHDFVVVDEVLHKRELRHMLFEAAEEIFDDFVVVWVRADDDVVMQRLTASKRKGHILNDPVPMYEAFKSEFEDFHRSVIVCSNNGTPEESIELLKDLIKGTAKLADRLSSN